MIGPDDQTGADPFDLPAMVDVVFILLAFFVLTAAIVPLERDFAATATTDEGVGEVTGVMLPSLEVRLVRVGDGVAITLGPSRVAVESFEDLTRRLDSLALASTQVVLTPDADVPMEAVMRAADAVLASAMPDLAIARLGAP